MIKLDWYILSKMCEKPIGIKKRMYNSWEWENISKFALVYKSMQDWP